MRLLLDTQVWLWLQQDPGQVGPELVQLEDGRNELLLSAASTWEIAIKYRIGKLRLPEPPAAYVPKRLSSSGVTPLAVHHAHTLAVAHLPDHHRDPLDRLLIAQAGHEGAALVTADPQIRGYDVEVLR